MRIFSWEASPFYLCTHIVLILHTQKVLHKCVPYSVSRRRSSYPSSSARAGFAQRKCKERQMLASPAHSRGWRRAQPPGSSVHALHHRPPAALHLAGHRPCHRVMAPVPPVGKATVTSVPPRCWGIWTVIKASAEARRGLPQACSPAGQEDTETSASVKGRE